MNIRLIMIVLVATGLQFGAVFGASAQNSLPNAGQLFSARGATPLRPTDTMVGPLASTHPLRIVFALKIPDWTNLKAFVTQPNHPLLTPAQFEAMYSPSIDDANVVADFLDQAGFTNVVIASNRLLVTGDAPAGTVSEALHTSFAQVLTDRGRQAFANTSAVQLPTSLQGIVLAVGGIQDIYRARPMIVTGGSSGAAPMTASGGSLVGHDPTDFPIIYGASALPAASGVPVGIVSTEDVSQVQTDVNDFTNGNNLPSVTVQVVGQEGSFVLGTLEEADLDSEVIVAMGGVRNLILYNTPGQGTLANLTTSFNAAVSADAVKVINVSYGECETTDEASEIQSADQIFAEADSQGQTFSASSGDNGAYPCPGTPQNGTYGSELGVGYPASSPYVVAVGGTDLYTTNYTTWNGETAWSYGGGGVSSVETPDPPWQTFGSYYRSVPDIAFDADPYSGADIIVEGSEDPDNPIGGTSLASPLFVGSWARILQAKGTDLGFAAPLLYETAAGSNYGGDFHDITSGTNGYYSAGSGWDYATGWGSLLVNNLESNMATTVQVPGTPSITGYYLISRGPVGADYEIEWSSVINGTFYRIWYEYGGASSYTFSTDIDSGTKAEVFVPTDSAHYEVQGCNDTACGSFSSPVYLPY
jgi:subtilase family serine protease